MERDDAGNDDIEDSAEQELLRSPVCVEMPSVSLETQEIFFRNISDSLSVGFLELTFTITHVMVDSTRYASVLLINQLNLFLPSSVWNDVPCVSLRTVQELCCPCINESSEIKYF